MLQGGVITKPTTPQDYISWVEDCLIYRGQIGLKPWEPMPQDIADLMLVSDLDGELEMGYLDLNSCLGGAVRDAVRDKRMRTLVFDHRNLVPRAMEILDGRIDQEISDPAIVKDLKRADVTLADKVIGLSRNKLLPPGYTVHLLGSRPKEGKQLSGMNGLVRSFRVPLSASFEDFIAKLYSESLIFWPQGQGINRGYDLGNSAWAYCLLSGGNGISSKTRSITGKSDYLFLLQHMSRTPTGKVVLWHDADSPPPRGEMAEAVAVSPGITSGPPLGTRALHGVTREEHDWLVNVHPVDIVDHVLELNDRGLGAYLSGDLVFGLQEYKRGLVFMNYLTRDPPTMQRLCNQVRATLNLNCALILLKLGSFEEAITYSLTALKVADLTNGQRASAHYRCGAGRAGLQDNPGAFEDLLKAFVLSPHDGPIRDMLDILEGSLSENIDPCIRKKHEAIRGDAPVDFPDGNLGGACESVLSPCEIRAIDRSKHISGEDWGLPNKRLGTKITPGSGSGTPAEKGDLGLPDNFWDDWTSEVDEDGEPLDRYGNPFFEPYDPYGIVRAVLKDPSLP